MTDAARYNLAMASLATFCKPSSAPRLPYTSRGVANSLRYIVAVASQPTEVTSPGSC